MTDCLFCKIIAGEIHSERILETDRAVAFLDIYPTNPGHVLVVPKTHTDDLIDASADDLKDVIVTAQRIGRALQHTELAHGFNVIQNNGREAGQVIHHLHVHVVPRLETDGLKHWPGHAYEDGEMARVAAEIRSAIATE